MDHRPSEKLDRVNITRAELLCWYGGYNKNGGIIGEGGKRMRVRFGREIVCQKCGKDDRITIAWTDKFAYHYTCQRCRVKVKEIDRSKVRHCMHACMPPLPPEGQALQ